MNCTVCQKGVLEVANSRKHDKESRVWRRRRCSACQTVFTTYETIDYDRTFSISKDTKQPMRQFSKSLLLAQLFASGGHLQDQSALFYLSETIARKAFLKACEDNMKISSKEYHRIILETLTAYDKLLGATFDARFPSDNH